MANLNEAYNTLVEQQANDIKKLKEEIEKLNKMKSIKWSREFACPEIQRLKEENEKLKNFHYTYDKNVWSPTELLQILDNYDLNWNEVCEEVKKLKEENAKLKEIISLELGEEIE